MEQPEDHSTLKQFTLFPKLPLELRLSIWELALLESRIVTLKSGWSEVDHRTFIGFGKSDKPPVLLQVNRESRSLTLRTYHLSFDSEHLFKCPKYFNNAKDTLHVMGEWMYCKDRPWLYSTPSVIEDFKKIRYLRMLDGMAEYCLWHPFPKPGMAESFITVFPALESFSIQDSRGFNSSNEDFNRRMINVQSKMLLDELEQFGALFSIIKLDIKHATGYSDEVFEFDVYFKRARDADTGGVLIRGE